ncbi:hypothetical protein HDU93_007227 [Gonapodya sp. JEL0774]|nr:hypothetical protein HDU93_007227 [Gonapodya sp. JEL0774]
MNSAIVFRSNSLIANCAMKLPLHDEPTFINSDDNDFQPKQSKPRLTPPPKAKDRSGLVCGGEENKKKPFQRSKGLEIPPPLVEVSSNDQVSRKRNTSDKDDSETIDANGERPRKTLKTKPSEAPPNALRDETKKNSSHDKPQKAGATETVQPQVLDPLPDLFRGCLDAALCKIKAHTCSNSAQVEKVKVVMNSRNEEELMHIKEASLRGGDVKRQMGWGGDPLSTTQVNGAFARNKDYLGEGPFQLESGSYTNRVVAALVHAINRSSVQDIPMSDAMDAVPNT